MQPGNAILQSLLLPGLAHFRLGLKGRGIVALLSSALLYWAGWVLLQDRLFFYTLITPERGSVLAALLRFVPVVQLPEAMNLAMTSLGSVLAFEPGYEAERLWRMPGDRLAGSILLEQVGGILTATSAYLSAFWAADAAFQARLRQAGREQGAAGPALAAGLSWLLPGLGHARVGQKDKGMLMGAAVVLLFAFGVAVAEGHAVDRALQPIWWMGQSLWGGGVALCAVTTAPLQFSHYPEGHDLGIVLCTVAGLMNLVVMIDAYTVAERAVLPSRAAGGGPAAEPEGPA